MSKTSPTDLVTITRADLVALADALAGDDRCGLSKPAILNKVAATLLGPKHDWARIKNADAPIASQRAAARAPAEATPPALDAMLRDAMTGEETALHAEVMPDGTLDVRLAEGMRIWVERHDGVQRAHVFDEMSEGPLTVMVQPGHLIGISRENYDLDIHPSTTGAPVAGADPRPVIGYQVDDPETGENWGDRPSFEIIPHALARRELDAAFEAGEERFRLLAIREGDIEEPTFSEA